MNTNNALFSIHYTFFDETRETEISMLVNNINILGFTRDGISYTTRWNLDEIAFWLRDFLNNMREDPYPVDVVGAFAAEKDISARDFDSDDIDELEKYYDRLYEWNLRHRWHPASSGAILADLYFQLVEDYVEISWNNEDSEDNVIFDNLIGGCRVQKDLFVSVINEFLTAYANHWYK
jgi:hypothetical protein